MKAIDRLASMLAMDDETIATLTFKAWSIVAGVLVLWLIPLWLSSVQQGYYYTFSSLLALQVFFDLGLGQLIVTLVSHEFRPMSEMLRGGDCARAERYATRLSGLLRILNSWYSIASILFVMAVGVGGAILFFAKSTHSSNEWLWPWILLVVTTGINFFLTPRLYFHEGCGGVAAVARLRLLQSIVGYGLTFIMLGAGAHLWSFMCIPLSSAVFSWRWLRHRRNVCDNWLQLASREKAPAIEWRRDIFPLQWRLGVSWVSGYFIFQLFTPLTFFNYGPTEAGKVGITLAMFGALSGFALSWISAKNSQMASLISARQWLALDALFFRVFRRFLIVMVAGSISIVLLAFFGERFAFTIAHRFAGLDVVICIAVFSAINAVVLAYASYMRAHMQEPMLWGSVVTALATSASCLATIHFGVFYMLLAYAAICGFGVLPWTIMRFKFYKSEFFREKFHYGLH